MSPDKLPRWSESGYTPSDVIAKAKDRIREAVAVLESVEMTPAEAMAMWPAWPDEYEWPDGARSRPGDPTGCEFGWPEDKS